MRSRIAVFAAVLAAAPGAEASFGGSPELAALQVALRGRGLYTGDVDGLTGPATRAAVLSFQSRHGLSADGIAGPLTLRALGRAGAPSPGSRVLRQGARGFDVAALQFMLASHGAASGPFDGVFGPRLRSAVRRFQRAVGLPADGIAGPLTLAALRRQPLRPPRPLRPPLRGRVGDVFGPRAAGFHAGVDIVAHAGTPAAAAAAGRVVFAGWRAGGHGRTVVLAHGAALRTLYAHLGRVGVRLGERVSAGAVLGTVGASGRASGPHLHFELRVRGLALDPRPAFAG